MRRASDPLAGLEKQRAQYKEAVDALADAARTRLILVTRAQPATLREVARTREELSAIGLPHQYLIINGLLPRVETAHDPLAAAIYARERAALTTIPEALKTLPCDQIALKPFDLVGLAALRLLLAPVAPPATANIEAPIALDTPSLFDLVDHIAVDGHGLVMLMGKGGVGKTTLAAAVAVELAHRGLPVHLTTSDPAAHLAETLRGSLANSRSVASTRTWRPSGIASMCWPPRAQSSMHKGRAMLEEDLRSPCTEEIAVFQAFSRIIREAGRKFVVMDTAPTGHTLLLLDATGAYHREVTRQMGKTGMHYTTPMMQLQDPKQTKVLIVTLAETTPVLEAANLQADLRRAGIEPWAWIINNSVAAAHPRSPLLRERAAQRAARDRCGGQPAHAALRSRAALLREEPVGVDRLLELGDRTAATSQRRHDMAEKRYNVLFICTGNSARSIMAEVILNHLGRERFRAFSAGSHPRGEVHPLTLEVLTGQGYDVSGLRSKSWTEFATPNTTAMDFIFTVCDQAAGEACPAWPGQPITAHWGFADPAAVVGDQDRQFKAFTNAQFQIASRIRILLSLPMEKLDRMSLQARLRELGERRGEND